MTTRFAILLAADSERRLGVEGNSCAKWSVGAENLDVVDWVVDLILRQTSKEATRRAANNAELGLGKSETLRSTSL